VRFSVAVVERCITWSSTGANVCLSFCYQFYSKEGRVQRGPFCLRQLPCYSYAEMAQQNTFDVVSKVDMAEVKNAVNQASKEIAQRYDFKGTNSEIQLDEKEHKLVLATASEFTLKSLNDVLQQKLVRRSVSLKALSYGKVEPAAKDSVRQTVTLQQGIPIEKAREIVKFIKDTKLRVQASINGDFVRVAGKDRDTLQQVIASLKEKDFGIDMQFTNYRSL
jgi:uncharacterized protein YajQ (UPF0234 family)